MPGQLTWNTIPLCVPDPDGELERWLAQFQRIEDVIAFCEPTAQTSSSNAPRNQAGTGITTPNYPEPPPLALNQLVWPAGATRFGYFVGVLPSSLSGVGALGSTGSLILSDGTTTSTVSMQVLAYRPLSTGNASLLILVDKRYAWQFANAGNIITASGYPMLDTDGTYSGTPNNDYGQLQISYAEVFAAIETAIGSTITKSDVSGFLVPDPLELSNRKYFNAAQMLDAVAQSCGLRVWLDFNGTVHAQSSTVSYTANFNDTTTLVAGGLATTNTPTPAQIIVNYRRASQYRAYADNDVYPISIPWTGTSGALVIESCAYAHWLTSRDNYVNEPDNLANLNSLASNIASGVGNWYSKAYDATFDGVKSWTITGYDNLLTITYAAQVSNDRNEVPGGVGMLTQDDERFDINYYRFTTRVQSMPANFGSYVNLSQDPSIRFLRGMQWGKLTAPSLQPIDGTTPQPVQVAIWQLNANWAEQDTGIRIEAYDVSLSTDTMDAGTRVNLWFHEVNRQWNLERISADSSIVRITGESSVANMAQKNAVCLWPGNVVTYNTDYPGCTGNQYQPKAEIWIAVINNDGETVNYLPLGDRYLGKPVGTYAVGDDSRPLYVIRADHHLIRFQLIAPMICGQATPANNAVQLYWDGTQYVLSSQVITVVDPYIADGGMFEGTQQTFVQIGFRGMAEWKPDRRVYEIVFMQRPAQWIRFKIRSGQFLALDSVSVLANVVDFWGGKNPDAANAGIQVFQQAGASTGIWVAPRDAVGLAVFDDYQNQYNIVFVQTRPLFIAGTLATDLEDNEATGTPTAEWGPIGFVTLAGATVNLIDKSAIFTGTTGDKFQGTYDAANDAYALTWVQCQGAV